MRHRPGKAFPMTGRAAEGAHGAVRAEPLVLFAATAALLVLSGIAPYDRLTWAMEVSWVVVILPLLIATRRRFPLTPLAYRLLFLHAVILIVGGYYTYARVPPGLWVADLFHLARNHYDRFGHLAQGFIPAIVLREILVRRSPLKGGAWLPFVVASVCLAFAAFFELIEWWSALVLGADADFYLALQGDPWDTQWDLFLALVGAIVALATLSRLHDRQLAALKT
jgi:putative membrane protein